MTSNQSPALSGEELDKPLEFEGIEKAIAQDAGASMHDVVVDLREFAGNSGYSHNDYADTMRMAANCIEALRARFWNYDHLARAARQAQPVDAGVQAATSPADERASLRLLVKSLESIRSIALQGGASVGSDEMRATGCFEEIAQKIPGLLAMVRAALAQAAPADLTDPVLATWPERIWLQHGESEPEVFPVTGAEITWSQDNINGAGDIEYVRADLARAAVVAIPAPAGYVRAGWFLYEGIEWVATSSDDPRATILYRAAPAAQVQPAGAPTIPNHYAKVLAMPDGPDVVGPALSEAAQPAGAGAPSILAAFVWPEPPPSKGQSHVLFEDGYAEGWAKAIDTVRTQLARQGAAPAQAEPVAWLPEGWEALHPPPASYLTDEAQDKFRVMVRRLDRPFCDKEGTRQWSGPTLDAALREGFAALGMPYATAPAHAGVAQADIERVANDLESEAIPYEGDFADSVRGAIEDLRTLAERTAVQTTDGATERRATNSHQQKR